MRLLYLGSTDFPQPKARAIQIVNTSHALARAGAEVTLVVGRRGRGSIRAALAQYALTPHPRLRVLRVPILRIPPRTPPALLRWFTRVWQASYLAGVAAILPLELAVRRPDFIYARDLRTARLATLLGYPLAVEVHGLPSYEARLGAGRSTLSAAHAGRLRRLEEQVFSRADRVVTITECARQILLDDYGLPPEKVRTVPDATRALPARSGTEPPSLEGSHVGPDLSSRACEGSIRARSRVDPSQARDDNTGVNTRSRRDRAFAALPAVYYVGQLYPWKGADLIAETAALVPSARFVIVGGLPNRNGHDRSLTELETLARQRGVGDRVELRGYIPYAQVARELQQAAVAIVPLPDEPVARLFTSPLKLFDYMAAGTPIVASDLPSVREVLRDGENALLVPPGNAGAFAAAIERLLAEPALARCLASQARADVAQHTWDARAARLMEFLGSRG